MYNSLNWAYTYNKFVYEKWLSHMQIFVVLTVVFLVNLLYFMIFTVKLIQWLSQLIIWMAIGVLLLFFANVLGGYIGLHIPINLFTVSISTILGILGVLSLAAIQIFIL